MNTETQGLYHKDFDAWAYDTVDKLRAKQFDVIDVENLIDEVEGLAGRDRRELYSRMVILLIHLMKWEFQHSLRCGSWRGSINTQRREINLILADSPSLKNLAIELSQSEKVFSEALDTVANETGLPLKLLPISNPYDLSQMLTVGFFPDK